MMKCFVVGLLLASAAAAAGEGTPRCSAVDPDTAKTGDKVNVTCQNADKTTFSEVYLTDGKNDIKVVVMELAGDKLTFQVPKIKTGRYHVAFLTVNKASMVEQPVVLTVE